MIKGAKRKPKERGRETNCTKEEVADAIRKARGKITLAGEMLGLSYNVIFRYMKMWPELKEVLREAKYRQLDVAEDKLFTAIDQGKAWGIMFYLKTQGKGRGYFEKVEQHIKAQRMQQVDMVVERLKTDKGKKFLAEYTELLAGFVPPGAQQLIEHKSEESNGEPTENRTEE